MKKQRYLLINLVLFFTLSIFSQERIKVGVFQGNGASQTCVWETKAACEIDRSLKAQIIKSKDLAQGILKNIDVLIIPGGGGSREYLNMGTRNHKLIKEFVRNGGGLIGICAGAYLTSNTPHYSCLNMSGAKAIDIEHDNRGRGVVKVTLNTEGKKVFPEVAHCDTLYIMYYEGPVVVENKEAKESYKTLATMQSDVHVEGDAPKNMTNNRPFYYLTSFGKGKVFSVVGHPEATPGMQWMIAKMVHTVATKTIMPQIATHFINPSLFNKEILMTKQRRSKESKLFKTFLYGDSKEKVTGIKWIGDVLSWDGKRWLQGLLYDNNAEVRLAATQTIQHCMYRYYLQDLKAAFKNEKNKEVKMAMQQAISFLE